MLKYKVLAKRLLVVISILIMLTVHLSFVYVVHWLSVTEVEAIGKSHFIFEVLPEQIVDCNSFITLNEETEMLINYIDEDVRHEISEYMKENKLKLKEGEHCFRRNGSYDELVNEDFSFVKISDGTEVIRNKIGVIDFIGSVFSVLFNHIFGIPAVILGLVIGLTVCLKFKTTKSKLICTYILFLSELAGAVILIFGSFDIRWELFLLTLSLFSVSMFIIGVYSLTEFIIRKFKQNTV